jgi:hypothetical protein
VQAHLENGIEDEKASAGEHGGFTVPVKEIGNAHGQRSSMDLVFGP